MFALIYFSSYISLVEEDAILSDDEKDTNILSDDEKDTNIGADEFSTNEE